MRGFESQPRSSITLNKHVGSDQRTRYSCATLCNSLWLWRRHSALRIQDLSHGSCKVLPGDSFAVKNIISRICTPCWLLCPCDVHNLGEKWHAVSDVHCAEHSRPVSNIWHETLGLRITRQDIVSHPQVGRRTDVRAVGYREANDVRDDLSTFSCFKHTSLKSAKRSW